MATAPDLRTSDKSRDQQVRVVSNSASRAGDIMVRWLTVPLVLIAAWQVAAWTLGSFTVASPLDTVTELWRMSSVGTLGAHLTETLVALAYGFSMAAIGGLAAGFLIGRSRFAYSVFEPMVMALYTMPKIALFPVFLFAFGLTMSAKAWLAMSFGIFPILIFTMDGTRSVSPVLTKVGRALGLSPLRMFASVTLPASLPSLVTGLRMGISVTFLGVILGGMFASQRGLGFLLIESVTLHNMPRLYALVFLLVLIALALNGFFLLLQNWASRGRPVQTGQGAVGAT